MPSPRRRIKHRSDQLDPAERLYLMTGSLTGSTDGSVPFADPVEHGWDVDLTAARAAWEAHRAELIDEMPPGLVPWAARKFDGAIGPSSFYDHLRGPESFGLESIQGTPEGPFPARRRHES